MCSLSEPFKPQWGLPWIPRKLWKKTSIVLLSAVGQRTCRHVLSSLTIKKIGWNVEIFLFFSRLCHCAFRATRFALAVSHQQAKITWDLTRVPMWPKFQMDVALRLASRKTLVALRFFLSLSESTSECFWHRDARPFHRNRHLAVLPGGRRLLSFESWGETGSFPHWMISKIYI